LKEEQSKLLSFEIVKAEAAYIHSLLNAKKTDILLYFNKESRVNESADANSRKGLALNY
jgi:hypothetical protein